MQVSRGGLDLREVDISRAKSHLAGEHVKDATR
jgi:hypothetical protein